MPDKSAPPEKPSGGSLRLRLVALASLWVSIALLATGVLLIDLFRDHVRRAFDAELSDHIDQLLILGERDAEGRFVLRRPLNDPHFSRPYSGWYWVIAPPNAPHMRSRSLWDADIAVKEGIAEILGPNGENLRGFGRAVAFPGSDARVLLFVAGPRAKIDEAVGRFASITGLAFLALAAGLIGAVVAQVSLGLKPLTRLRVAMADVRTARARKLEGDYPAEIQPLADEVNQLIRHDAEVVERARTHVGNLAHALKTPLAVLSNEADKTPGASGELMRAQIAAMSASIDHHLRRARIAAAGGVPGARVDVAQCAEALIRTIGRLAADRRLHATLEGVRGYHFRGERQDLDEMLGNLLDNAFKWAKGRVRVTLGGVTGSGEVSRLSIVIEDDGPGVPQSARALVLERGRRVDETKPGAGLGLAIVRDLAEIYGGALSLDSSRDLGGLAARLELPAALGEISDNFAHNS